MNNENCCHKFRWVVVVIISRESETFSRFFFTSPSHASSTTIAVDFTMRANPDQVRVRVRMESKAAHLASGCVCTRRRRNLPAQVTVNYDEKICWIFQFSPLLHTSSARQWQLYSDSVAVLLISRVVVSLLLPPAILVSAVQWDGV